jgi:hypothetical protein
VIAWREGQELKKRAFLLSQSDDIEDAGPLEFDFVAPATIEEVDVSAVSKQTGLTFPGLV